MTERKREREQTEDSKQYLKFHSKNGDDDGDNVDDDDVIMLTMTMKLVPGGGCEDADDADRVMMLTTPIQ